MLKKSVELMLKSFIKLVMGLLMMPIFRINFSYKIREIVLIKDDSTFPAV